MSSPWAQWGALLMPRPDPRDFARPRASSSSSVHPPHTTLRHSLSSKSLSAAFARKKTRKTAPIPAVPPRLQPLAFTTEPIVDLTLPPYKRPPSPPVDGLPWTPNASSLAGDRTGAAPTPTEAIPRSHLAASAGHSERQRRNEFNYNHVTHDANMSSAILPQPHDEYTNACTAQPGQHFYSSQPSSLSPYTSNNSSTSEASLRRANSHPLPIAASFSSSTASLARGVFIDPPTRCPATAETHPNNSIAANDMLKFRRKTSNVPNSAADASASSCVPSSATTTTSIIRRLTKKNPPPPSIPSLTVTPPPAASAPVPPTSAPAAANPRIAPEMQLFASATEAAVMPAPSTPAAPVSPFSNISANNVGDATTGAGAAPDDARLPLASIAAPRNNSTQDRGRPQMQPQVQVQESRSSNDSYSPCVSGPPTAQGRGASLESQVQRDSSEPEGGVETVGPKAETATSNHRTIHGGSLSECGHGMLRTLAEALGSDEDSDDADADGSSQRGPPSGVIFGPARHTPAWTNRSAVTRLSRSECGHDSPRSLDARSILGVVDSLADAARVTAASSASRGVQLLQTQEMAPAVRAFSNTAALRAGAFSRFVSTTVMSDHAKRSSSRQKQQGAGNVLHKRRTGAGVASSASSSSSASSVVSAHSIGSPLSRVLSLASTSTAAAGADQTQHHQASTSTSTDRTQQTAAPSPSGASSSTMVATSHAPPSSWADLENQHPQPYISSTNAHTFTESPSASSESSSSHEYPTTLRSASSGGNGNGKGAFGFLRWRRWSVGRGVGFVHKVDGGEGGTRRVLDEGRERGVRSSSMDGGSRDIELESAPGPSLAILGSTSMRLPRPRSMSHGKLIKPRLAELTTQTLPASRRRPKFILGNDSEADLPSAHHQIMRMALTPATPPPPPRPPLLPHTIYLDPARPAGPGRRRWTLASAMLDEGVSDASLVRELERMHAITAWERAQRAEARRLQRERGQEQEKEGAEGVADAGEEKGEGAAAGDDGSSIRSEDVWDIDVGLELWDAREVREREEALTMSDSPVALEGPQLPSPTSAHRSNTLPMTTSMPTSSSWLAAQRALLTCRELLLTERRYLLLMQTLLGEHTVASPPPLMLHYVAELVRASAGVLADMERRPSIAGVCDAFVQHQGELEAAYVRWCGIVGGWFVAHPDGTGTDEVAELSGGDGGVEGHGAAKRMRTAGDVEPQAEAYPPVSPLKRTVSTWRKSMPTMPSLGLGAVDENEGAVYIQHGNGNVALKREDDATATTMPPVTVGGKPPRKHTVRDLAILPTQRVMRYVLLYRDLLSHIPPSSTSRVLVERAIEAACRIADKCNRAQGNAAFIVGNPNSPPVTGFSGARSGSGASNSSRGSSRRGGTTSSSSRPSSPSTKTLESMSSTSHSLTPTSMSGSTAVTSATSLSSHSHSAFVDNASTVKAPPGRHVDSGRGLGSAHRTSMSAVSLSLMTSMGFGKGRASVPQPMPGS